MSDLVQRLRAQRPEDRQVYWRNAESRQVIPIMDEAADALERVERERDEAIALLKEARRDVEEVAYQLGNPERDFAMNRLARIDALLEGRGDAQRV